MVLKMLMQGKQACGGHAAVYLWLQLSIYLDAFLSESRTRWMRHAREEHGMPSRAAQKNELSTTVDLTGGPTRVTLHYRSTFMRWQMRGGVDSE
jgi:hypothetical protein